MSSELSFQNLPFVPVEGQVIYIESYYHEKLNQFIRSRHQWLRNVFLRQGLEFCYIPLLAEETIAYHAPYISTTDRNTLLSELSELTTYCTADKEILPSLVFALDIPVKDTEGNTVLQCVSIDMESDKPLESTFEDLANTVKEISDRQSRHYHNLQSERFESGVRFSLPDDYFEDKKREKEDFSNQYHFDFPRRTIERPPFGFDFDGKDKEKADRNFDDQSRQLIREIKERIDALRNRGVNTMFLHNIIDGNVRLSRMRITKDFRIILLDYDNLEIKLSVLPKAVFLLFLHHPEGIRFKELTDYYSELLKLYRSLNPIGGPLRHEQSIRDVTDPCNNSINEKCARIREAFVNNFDERLARHYYITGKRGEAKRIMLDRSLILWD